MGSRNRPANACPGDEPASGRAKAGGGSGTTNRGRPAAVYLSRIPQPAVRNLPQAARRAARRSAAGTYLECGAADGPAGRPMTRSTLLRVDLQAGYSAKPVLRDIRFELNRGEVLGLVGTSGAGKSTLVLALLGLLPWRGGRVRGEVLLEGTNLLELPERQIRLLRGRTVSLIPQSPMTALNSAISLRRHFYEAWRAHEGNGRLKWNERVLELLSDVQLPLDPDFLLRRPTEISVGQAQR